MTKKLLFLAIVLLTAINGFSQAEAFPAPNIHQCGSEVFDLTVQTPIILGEQDPENFSVLYYLTQPDAEAGTNQIANPVAFVGQQQQMIFAKVTNNTNGDQDITNFHISWSSGFFVPNLPDVTACEAYSLQALTTGNYYTGPGGTGTMLQLGTIITTTQIVYIYAENDLGCTGESSFLVTINAPLTFEPTPLYACDDNGDGIATFDLTEILPQLTGQNSQLNVNFFHTQLSAENNANPILNIQAFLNTVAFEQTIYANVNVPGSTCIWVVPIELIVIECNGNTISGFVSLNFDDNCDTFEAAGSGLPVYYTHNNDVYVTYTNADGYYSFENVPDGPITVYVPDTPLITVSPANYTVTMPGNEENINFCITSAIEVINDVAVTLVPTTVARPGFNATYALIYQNLGNVLQSGTVSLQFDDAHITFLSALPAMVQTGNTLTFSYTNLLPFQTKIAIINFTVMLPQVTPDGTVLNFTANITPLAGDINTANNTAVLNQTVVNSYDPNDIAVREGEFIAIDQVEDYLTYTIRFQNMGTAEAVNIRVAGTLDANLDWSTFEPLASSHAYKANRVNDEIEFLYDNINLPHEDADEPGSHGFVVYKIKPKAGVTVGDVMAAQAGIYFDFNDPVMTNIVETTVQETAGLNENSISSFTVYPNPAAANINLMLANTAADGFNVTLTDVLGKTVLKNSFAGNQASLSIGSLTSGIYFVTINADGKQSTKKLVVK